jgi:DNA-binding NarL/FixJ family response regulator
VSERRPTVLLADDHPMVLQGLREILEPISEVIETAADGQALLEAVERRRPDLVIVDISMPGLDGIEATRRLQTLAPGPRVLILSIHVDPEYVQAAFAAGACGYLTKTSSPEEIERAVHEVLAGNFYVSPEITRAAILPAARSQESPPPRAAGTLTRRELDILHLVAEGLGNEPIAQRLGVGETTVRTHLNSLYRKLRLKNRVELALYAAHAGDVTP